MTGSRELAVSEARIGITGGSETGMQKLFILSILAVIATVTLFGQKEDKEGKAWLDGCADAATMNVTGLWRSPDWGRLSLNQSEGSRKVVGSGDGWEISGVVSGTTACLLFSHNGKIAYTAKLTAEGATALTGVYAKGLLTPGVKTIPMHLAK